MAHTNSLCGWVLVDIGTTSLRYRRELDTYQHQFVPFAYLFCRAEREDRLSMAFETLRDCLTTFFGLSRAFVPSVLQVDHCPAIVNGARAVWPDIVVVTCWAHIFRKALKENRSKFADRNFFKTAEQHMTTMHLARSYTQFCNMWTVIKSTWLSAGEQALTEWFEHQYCSQPWASWFVAASGVMGIPSNNQSIESEH